jgi:hypothetical protein
MRSKVEEQGARNEERAKLARFERVDQSDRSTQASTRGYTSCSVCLSPARLLNSRKGGKTCAAITKWKGKFFISPILAWSFRISSIGRRKGLICAVLV